MNILRYVCGSDVDKLKAEFASFGNKTVVALGFFDGMHKAHRELFRIARAEADRIGCPLAVFTFSGKSASLKSGVLRLFTDAEKLQLLCECGADIVLSCDFDALSDMPPDSFVRDFLCGTMRAGVAVCGYNFRFGRGASGTARELSALMKSCGGDAVVVDKLYVGDVSPSSTLIRELLSKRQLRRAWELLGIPYFITGEVQHGKGIGTSMGIPTVNTELSDERFALPCGVYSTAVPIGGKVFRALTNIGSCPTFGERHVHAETYILGFDGDLYTKQLRIYFVDYLREEKSFADKDELIKQINDDKIRAFELSKEIKWQEIGLN